MQDYWIVEECVSLQASAVLWCCLLGLRGMHADVGHMHMLAGAVPAD